MFAKDPSFRIGCGRYVQKSGALKSCGVEILRLGRAPLIVAGKTAWQIAGASVSEGLAAENIDFSLEIYGGSCNAEAAEALAKKARAEGRDVIVGVGGGVIMDFAKLIARMAATALRSMQGICTRPFTGSQVKPRLCSMAISAAFSIWSIFSP
jgi:glycerol dehydrogenase